jgi:hypothetical protein
MPNRAELSTEEWRTFYSLLLLNLCVHISSEENCKRFLNAVFRVLRSGHSDDSTDFTGPIEFDV